MYVHNLQLYENVLRKTSPSYEGKEPKGGGRRCVETGGGGGGELGRRRADAVSRGLKVGPSGLRPPYCSHQTFEPDMQSRRILPRENAAAAASTRCPAKLMFVCKMFITFID